jgi:hypothetical protein
LIRSFSAWSDELKRGASGTFHGLTKFAPAESISRHFLTQNAFLVQKCWYQAWPVCSWQYLCLGQKGGGLLGRLFQKISVTIRLPICDDNAMIVVQIVLRVFLVLLLCKRWNVRLGRQFRLAQPPLKPTRKDENAIRNSDFSSVQDVWGENLDPCEGILRPSVSCHEPKFHYLTQWRFRRWDDDQITVVDFGYNMPQRK